MLPQLNDEAATFVREGALRRSYPAAALDHLARSVFTRDEREPVPRT